MCTSRLIDTPAAKPWTRALVLAFGLLTGTMLGGCYERVTAARGLGAQTVETQEPYQQDTEVDRWFYGQKEERPR